MPCVAGSRGKIRLLCCPPCYPAWWRDDGLADDARSEYHVVHTGRRARRWDIALKPADALPIVRSAWPQLSVADSTTAARVLSRLYNLKMKHLAALGGKSTAVGFFVSVLAEATDRSRPRANTITCEFDLAGVLTRTSVSPCFLWSSDPKCRHGATLLFDYHIPVPTFPNDACSAIRDALTPLLSDTSFLGKWAALDRRFSSVKGFAFNLFPDQCEWAELVAVEEGCEFPADARPLASAMAVRMADLVSDELHRNAGLAAAVHEWCLSPKEGTSMTVSLSDSANDLGFMVSVDPPEEPSRFACPVSILSSPPWWTPTWTTKPCTTLTRTKRS